MPVTPWRKQFNRYASTLQLKPYISRGFWKVVSHFQCNPLEWYTSYLLQWQLSWLFTTYQKSPEFPVGISFWDFGKHFWLDSQGNSRSKWKFWEGYSVRNLTGITRVRNEKFLPGRRCAIMLDIKGSNRFVICKMNSHLVGGSVGFPRSTLRQKCYGDQWRIE